MENCKWDMEKLRVMLREEAERAAKAAHGSQMAVAEAVRAWYLAEYPHLGVMTNQPDLGSIVAGCEGRVEVHSADLTTGYFEIHDTGVNGKPGAVHKFNEPVPQGVPEDVVALILSGDIEPVLMRAGEEEMRLKLYQARQALAASTATSDEVKS